SRDLRRPKVMRGRVDVLWLAAEAPDALESGDIVSGGEDSDGKGLKLPVVSEADKRFERDNLDQRRMNQVCGQPTGRGVVAELPSVAAKHEKSAGTVSARNGVGEAHDLERDLLLGGAAGLLPLE